MATAKLWWNGSAWVTSDTTAASKTSYYTNNPGIRAAIKLVAFDDAAIKLYAALSPDGQSGESNTLSGTFSTSYGGVSADVHNWDRSGGADLREKWSSATAATTGTISWSTGSSDITGTYYRGGAKYYSRLQWTGSQIVGTSPFCTVSFDDNGGSGGPSAQTICKGASSALSSTVPTRAGYSFLGWGTSSASASATYSPGGSVVFSADTTLYAVWQANGYGLTVTKPAAAAITILRNGETFSGNTVYHDDVLTITATPAPGYRITALQVNGSDFVSGGTHTVSGAVAIAADAVAQSSTIATYDRSVNTLDTFSLIVNRYSTSHYNKLRYYDSGGTLLHTSAVFTESTSLTVPQSWFDAFGTVTAIMVTAVLTTYTDPECTTVTGVTDSCTFTVAADATMKPTLAAGCVTMTPYNTGTGAASLTNPGYVKGYSKVRAVFDTSKITHAAGASAGTYAISVQGTATSGSNTTLVSSNTVTAAGTLTITCTVTDSRGRSTAATQTISVNDYANPAIASLNCYRCDSSGAEDENDPYMAVTAACTFTALADNAVTITVQVKPAGGSYTSFGTLTNAAQSVIGGAFLADTSYFVKVTVTDTVGSSAYTEMNMPRRSWVFHMRNTPGGPGAAFGKVTEHDNALQLASGWDFMMGDTSMSEAELQALLNGGSGVTDVEVDGSSVVTDGVAEIPDTVHVGASAPTDPKTKIWLDTDEQGVSVVTSVNGQSGAVSLNPLIDLIWTNPSPTSNFNAQTMSIDLSGYDYLIIKARRSTSSTACGSAVIPIDGDETIIFGGANTGFNLTGRTVKATSSSIVFSSGYLQGNNTDSVAWCIPIKIYGVRGTLL